MSEREAFEIWFKLRYPLHELASIYGAIAWDAWQAGVQYNSVMEAGGQKPIEALLTRHEAFTGNLLRRDGHVGGLLHDAGETLGQLGL